MSAIFKMAAKTRYKKMGGKNSTLSDIIQIRTNSKHISITPPSFMKFCPVVPEICRGQVHVPKKERRRKRIIIRNGAKTISLSNF
jgi:hypothetical protein